MIRCPRFVLRSFLPALLVAIALSGVSWADHVAKLQTAAIKDGKATVGHWGNDAENYTAWGSHSNRLIPLFTFGTRGGGGGVDLAGYVGKNSAYRDKSKIVDIYGRLPVDTLNPQAEYCDQTTVGAIQQAGFERGKKHIFLVVFDGMDWQTIQAASIHRLGKVAYESGRGAGLHFQDYNANGSSQFGFTVTSPHNSGTKGNADQQTVTVNPNAMRGGYDTQRGGAAPWLAGENSWYPIGRLSKEKVSPHAYADSASTATAMTTGVKTYNGSINVDPAGQQLRTIAHRMQAAGFAVGAVSSVPISHATPAAAYAHNVTRGDYQDLSRDMLGLPSIAHPKKPLAGLDVVLGGGFGVIKQSDKGQGENFLPGNGYVSGKDIETIDVRNGGKYVVSLRKPKTNGREQLQTAAATAAKNEQRLFGMYGLGGYRGHVPFQTADGDFQPVPGRGKKAEKYSPADLSENPTLANMTDAALTVLSRNPKGFWLMVEAGDVDWANHDNNLDNSIGAVYSGEAAVRSITRWVEKHSNWDESLLIVTADHGHYLVLERPELLIPPKTR
jgi:alkaline phosphatase